MLKTAPKYYINSVPTILNNFNWWSYPLVFVKPVLIKVKDVQRFYVSNLMDIWTLKEVLVDRVYEHKRKIQPGDVVVDIGAAIGDFSIDAAQKAKRVIAYEMDVERLGLMKKNMRINSASKIELHQTKAVSLEQILVDVETCDFFKIDCEGGEYEIFKNPNKTELLKIKHIAMEAHKFDEKMKRGFIELVTTLESAGFDVEIVPNPVHDYICYLYATRMK